MEREIELTNNHFLQIKQEESPDDPRSWDNLGIMACFHRRYSLGDDNIPFHSDDFNSWSEMEEHLRTNLKAVVILPLYLYDHSGITMNTTGFSCRWDSGQVGLIYVTEEKMKEEYGEINEENLAKAKRVLEGEVKTYDSYLTGDIYSFKLVKKSTCDHGHVHEELVDSCGGFYGSDPDKNGMWDHIGEQYRPMLKTA